MAVVFAPCADDEFFDSKLLQHTINTETLKKLGFHASTTQEVFVKDLNKLLETFADEEECSFDTFAKVWNDMKFAYIFHGHQTLKERKWFIHLSLRTCVLALCNPARGEWQRFGAVYALYSLHQCQYLGANCQPLPVAMLYGEMVALAELCRLAWRRVDTSATAMDLVYCMYKMMVNDVIQLQAHPRQVNPHIRFESYPLGHYEDTYTIKTKKKYEAEQLATRQRKTKEAKTFASKYNLNLLAESLKTFDTLSSTCSSAELQNHGASIVKDSIVQQILKVGEKMSSDELRHGDIEELTTADSQRTVRYEARQGDDTCTTTAAGLDCDEPRDNAADLGKRKWKQGKMSTLRRRKHMLWGATDIGNDTDDDDDNDVDYKP